MAGILKYLLDFMKTIPEGFPRQRLARLPSETLRRCRKTKLVKDLYVTDLGHFPASAGHFVDRPTGCSSHILIFCIAGIGWFAQPGLRKIPVRQGGVVCIPAGTPHRYGSSEKNPWQIHWVHFDGLRSADYLARLGNGIVGEVSASECRSIVDAFEETHASLQEGFTEGGLFVLSANLARLLALISRARQAPGKKSRLTNQRIVQSMHWLREHLAEPLTLPQIAAKAGLSVPHYCALFKKQTGQTPVRYLIDTRISMACALLDSTDQSVSEISEASGFNDPFHFSRSFRAIVGASPKAYREEGAKLFPQ